MEFAKFCKSLSAKVAKGEELSLYETVLAGLLNRKEAGFSLEDVAKGSGISVRTIQKMAYGPVVDPAVSSCEAIARFLRAKNSDSRKSAMRA
jgi:DNA-binding XRE family transcriptional regulator